MRRVFLLALIVLPSILFCQFFPDLEWQRFYGKSGDDTPGAIALASDGSLLLGGSTITHRPDEAPDQNAWVVKVDTTGYELWEREIMLPGRQEIFGLKGTEDGGVIFCGSSSYVLTHPEPASRPFRADVLVGRLNALGEVMWVKHYGGTGQDRSLAITEGVYNEWLVAGAAHSPGGVGEVRTNLGQSDMWMLKLNQQGEIRHTESFGGAGSDWANTALTCKNGDFVIAGFSNSTTLDKGPASLFGNGWVLRLSPQGKVRWSRLFHCPQGGFFNDATELPDERICLAGQRTNADGLEEGWMLKLSPDGAKVQEKVFANGGIHRLDAVTACQDGGLLLGGSAIGDRGEHAKGGSDLWLYRLNKQGDIIWKNTYGGPDFERCVAVLEAHKGLFYVLGQKVNDFQEEEGSRKRDFWLLRIQELPCEYLQASISVRARNNTIPTNLRVRFRANDRYATRYEWDFGDNTTSGDQDPLKSFRLPGMYRPRLTVYANEGCWRTVRLPNELIVE
ncbi:MAG: PKD domain-containing protein [Bacteroidia bacterium]